MDHLHTEVFAYLQHMWCETAATEESVAATIQPYADFLETLVPQGTPYAKYIHKERMLYDQFINDEILVFRYDAEDDNESFYSESELSDDISSETKSFINDVRLMDESDFREQITANEFTGGYWIPQHHWVLSKTALHAELSKTTVASNKISKTKV